MEDVRKRIMNELFVAPSVVLPIVGGASAWLLSWAVGGVDMLNIAGLVGVLVGIGWFATRFIFQIDSIAEKAMRDQVAEQIRREEAKLDDLMERLRADRDPRSQDCLKRLRSNRAEIERVAQTPGVQLRSLEIVKQSRQLFWAAIDQLEQALKMYHLSEQQNGSARREVLAQREQFLNEAFESAEHLRAAVETFRNLVDKNQQRDLDTLQKELSDSIEAAKRSDERMKELESSPNYESYLKE